MSFADFKNLAVNLQSNPAEAARLLVKIAGEGGVEITTQVATNAIRLLTSESGSSTTYSQSFQPAAGTGFLKLTVDMKDRKIQIEGTGAVAQKLSYANIRGRKWLAIGTGAEWTKPKTKKRAIGTNPRIVRGSRRMKPLTFYLLIGGAMLLLTGIAAGALLYFGVIPLPW